MPDPKRTHTRRQPGNASGPAGQLREIRARVAKLCQRIKKDKDASAIQQVQDELSRVGDVLSDRLSAHGHASAQSDAAWPGDMNDESQEPEDWGADPPEVRRG